MDREDIDELTFMLLVDEYEKKAAAEEIFLAAAEKVTEGEGESENA